MPSAGIVTRQHRTTFVSRVPPASVRGTFARSLWLAIAAHSIALVRCLHHGEPSRLATRRNTMKRSITVVTTSLALLILGLAFSVGTAVAQSAKDLVGTWTPVSAEVFGPNPKGNLTFDANGRFSLQLLRADLKKIAANKRDMGTPEENNAIVHGSISYYVTYTMNGTELVLHVEASSFPNWTGTDQKRTNVSLTADQLTYTNPAPSVGPGTPTILVWKRTPAVRTN